MVVGYCVCCPKSSETMLADMREMGPTYFLATPRVLEALLTQVSIRMEDTGGFNQRLYRAGMAVAHRIEAGRTASLSDRLTAAACNLLIYGPLRDVLGMSNVRVAFTAGDAAAPALVTFFRALGINLKQLYGSTETGFFVAMQRDGQVKPDTVGPAADGVELKFTRAARNPGAFTRPVQGVSPRPARRPRRQGMPTAGSIPATPAIWAMTGICGSSTA